MPNLVLDHIVLVVPNLKEAISFFEDTLEVTPIMGGKHLGYGTHNALLGLGSSENLSYLELFAIDPEDNTQYESYPMGVSKKTKEMYVGTWCIRCDRDTDIVEVNRWMQKLGKEYNHGSVRKMHRITPSNTTLSWQIASAPEQVILSKGQIPFLIKWDNLALHPATKLEVNCIPYDLSFFGPTSSEIHKNLRDLGFENNEHITFKEKESVLSKLSLYGKKNTIHFGSCSIYLA